MNKPVRSSLPAFDATTFMNPAAFKETMEKSMSGFTDVSAEGKRTFEALSTSAGIAAKAAQTLGAETGAYYKSALEAYAAQAKAITGVRSIQEAVELQSSYAKSSMDAFMAHVSSASELVSSTIKDTVRPLNERATAVAEQFTTAR